MKSVYDEGIHAHRSGHPRNSAPYPEGSDWWFTWLSGWDEAERRSSMDLIKMARATDLKKS